MTYSDDVPMFSDPSRPESDLRHVLMPNMAWACGGSIITKGGHIGWLHEFDQVTCPDCRAEGFDSIYARQQRQQGKQP